MVPYSVYVGAVLCVLLVEVKAIATATNVDISEPTVIRSPAMNEDPDDGFGWAAIFHQIEPVLRGDSMGETIRKTRVIVGAPRGSYPGGLNLTDPELPAVNRTGLVYSCPIGPGECEGVRGDTSRYIGGNVDITNGFQNSVSVTNQLFDQRIAEGRLFDQAPNSDSIDTTFNNRLTIERKTGQLMGAVLYSTGDTLVACAPRWVVNPFILGTTAGSQPRGICFSGDRGLQNFKSEFPCSGVGFAGSSRREGYCSAGVSVTIMEDQIHIAAPGYQQFGGAVYSRLLAAAIDDPYSRTISHLNENDISRTSYHGIAVASGYVTSSNRTQGPPDLLVAASRDNQTMYIGRVYMYNSTTLSTIQAISVAEGTQMAEFFGYSMILCDLTGDGFDELLVGAPMYTSIPRSRSNQLVMTERGRVYVFYNTGGSLSSDPVMLDGFTARSRFGLTIANLGDINADGHEDVAIGAPYEDSSDSTQNTGAVYIYYGKNTREEFRSQTPQRIHGDDIVNSVEGLTSFKTFGFSLSGNTDVDNNQYNDVVVGGYSSQVVVVLRSLPVANVTVRFSEVPDIRVDISNPVFDVRLTASYDAVQVPGPIRVPFTLSEMTVDGDSRLFFTRDDAEDVQYDGMFILPAPNMEVMELITIYAVSNFTETRPYHLLVQLNDVERTLAPVVDGQQPLSDLSAFPRIQQSGDDIAMINLINPCGEDGCESDISLSVLIPGETLTLLQGQDRRIPFQLDYTNVGDEEARDVRLSISGFPDGFFQQFILSPAAQEGVTFDCSRTDTGSLSCFLQERFLSNQTRTLLLTLVVDRNGFMGNEGSFSLVLNIEVDISSNNTDTNFMNNEVRIPFAVESESNINVDVSFGSDQYSYGGMAQASSALSSSNLGNLVTLLVTVDNTGPSTIQSASVNISFPSRVSQDSDSLFYLYPARVLAMSGSEDIDTVVTCSEMGIDPNGLIDGPSFMYQTNKRRRRRSLPTGLGNKRGARQRRQNSAVGNLISCTTDLCVTVMCNIQRLSADGVTVTVEFNVDERFYASARGRDFSIRAEASASVRDEFQVVDDDPSDNSDGATVVLFQAEGDADNLQLIHVIIWPTIGAVILLILFVLLLYYLGFFKRKPHDSEPKEEADDGKEESTGL